MIYECKNCHLRVHLAVPPHNVACNNCRCSDLIQLITAPEEIRRSDTCGVLHWAAHNCRAHNCFDRDCWAYPAEKAAHNTANNLWPEGAHVVRPISVGIIGCQT